MVLFRPWTPGTAVELDVLLAKQSAKEYVLRQSETYLKYQYVMEGSAAAVTDTPEQAAHAATAVEAEGAGLATAQDSAVTAREVVSVEPINDAPAQVIFGLRPCDARGFAQMDNVFGGYGGFYFDPYYNAKRDATTLVAVTCSDSALHLLLHLGRRLARRAPTAWTRSRPRSTVDCTVEALTPKGEALLGFAGLSRRVGRPE